MIYNIKQKIWISIGLFMISNILLGQEKYQSLLWEISGNNLEKPSYLYGTMHVSSKLAFHLTDNFFESLESVDIVALESDPTQWLSETEELDDQPILNTHRFYRQFQHRALDKYNLAEQLATDHTMINSLLYRSNSAMQDFQEDTYLDMFIFQAGSRFHKEIVGLEDFKESRNLVMQAYSGEVVKDNQPTWLEDLLKEKNYDVILRDSYRSNDLDMIDSLNSGFSTENYLEHMLYKRNENMVEVYDSIIQTGKTIFAGVGAAHLPGINGMIEGFRAKGYTVKPIKGDWTEKGKKAKQNIENKRVKRTFSLFKSSDGFIEFMSPSKVHEVSFYGKTMYLAPDLTNGSYVAVSRMKLNQFSRTKEEVLNFEDIDKILIEYIPGEIKSKTPVLVDGIEGLNIWSQTKRGDHHRYTIFKTPLEFIIFKMVGKNDDVKQESDQLFNSIHFNYSNKKVDVKPLQGGFTVKVPDYYLLDHNNVYTSKIGNPHLQAYDENSKTFYFAQQLVLNDDVFLEKDNFELNRILDVYFKSLDVDTFTTEQDTYKLRSRLMGFGKSPLGKDIALSVMINGGHYYLLGCSASSKEIAKSYFNSFQYIEMNYNLPFEEIRDTNLQYKVFAPRKADMIGNGMNGPVQKRKKFRSVTKRQVFNSISKQQVFLKYHKYNDYSQYDNIDSLWQAILNFKIKKGQVVEYQKRGVTEQNDPYLDIIMADTATVRKLKFKYIIHGGVQYKLSTVLDSNGIDDDVFVNSIFNTFQPLDSLIGVSPIQKKAGLFFKHLYSGVDSLEERVLDHYTDIKFYNEDKEQLIHTIENWNFKDEDLKVKKYLIKAFSNLKSEDRLDYLTKWYSTFSDNADMQIHILSLLSRDATKRSYKQIGEFLSTDIPLPYKKSKIKLLFFNLNKNPELEAEIIDNIMNLLSIKEYTTSVLKTLSLLYEKDVINKRFLKKYKKQLISLAKVELKRARSQQIANSGNAYSTSEYNNLNYLIHILLAFRSDDDVNGIYEKIKDSDFKNEYTRILAHRLKFRDKIDPIEVYKLAENIKTRAFMYKTFAELEIKDMFPEEFSSVDSLASSALNNRYIKKNDDKLEFYVKHHLIKEKEAYTILYYKLFTTDYQNKEETKLVYVIYKDNHLDKPVKTGRIEGEFREHNTDKIDVEEERFKLDKHPRVVFSDATLWE